MPACSMLARSSPTLAKARIATFNVRGLTSNVKKQQLAKDLLSYRVDVCGLQELKIAEPFDRSIDDGYRLVGFGQDAGHHGGIGFAVSKYFNEFLRKHKKLSDRVGYADFSLPAKSSSETSVDVRFVVAYGPTAPSADKTPSLREDFYDCLFKAWNTPNSRTLVFGLGDFNSIGLYSKGVRNNNGQALVQWANSWEIVLANTLFRYSMRYRTTWTGSVTNRDTGVISRVYNMIDFIAVPARCRPLIKRARSYAGTLTSSDHKIVIADMDFQRLFKAYRSNPKTKRSVGPLAVRRLSLDATVRQDYKAKLKESVSISHTNPCSEETHKHSPSQKWSSAVNGTLKAAESSVGHMHRSTSGRLTLPNQEVARLSEQQREVRLLAESGHHSLAELKRQRNQIQHKIRSIQRADANERLDRLAEKVEQAPDSAQMFLAASAMRSGSQPSSIMVSSADGHILASDKQKAERVTEHFKDLFCRDQSAAIQKPVPHRLSVAVSPAEVETAMKRLKNGKACGPDKVPGELLKYGTSQLSIVAADIINQSVAEGADMSSFTGLGTLIPLQKPKKPRGPVTSLRPIVLLNTIRKVFSLVVLCRIAKDVARYVGPTQSGFRQGRSTTDVVWTQR
eukprot:scpid21182/ scgid34307/ Craniofacial development protein 2; p97 bucentaur protein